MPVDKNINALVKSLAKKPKLFKYLTNYIADPNIGSAIYASLSVSLEEAASAKGLYDSLKKDKIALVPEQITPYLLKNGLLESLSLIVQKEAKEILKEVLKTSFAQQQNLAEQDIINLNGLVDNTIALVASLRGNSSALEDIGAYLADRIESPQKIAQQLERGEINPQEAKELENKANLILTTALLESAQTEETKNAILGLINQLAKTIDGHHAVILSKTPEEIEKKKGLIARIDRQLETNSLNPNFYYKCVAQKEKIEEELSLFKEQIDKLSKQSKQKDVDTGTKDTLNSIIAEINKKVLKSTIEIQESNDSLRENTLDSKFKIRLTEAKKKLEAEIQINPLDTASLYVTEQLGLKPDELTKIASLSKYSIGALLSDHTLAQELAKIPTLEAKDKMPELVRLAPQIVENQAGSILRALENDEFKGIIRGNQFVKDQLAVQGFTGQEDKILGEVLDNLVPNVIKPSLEDSAFRALMNPEVSTEYRIKGTIDFLNSHRDVTSTILSSSLLTNSELAKTIVTRVADDDKTRELVSQISVAISENQESLQAIAKVVLDHSDSLKGSISTLMDPAQSTETKIHSTIDFLDSHRDVTSAILSSSLLTDPELAKAIVTRVADDDKTRSEALVLVPQISTVISKNKESLQAIANVALNHSETIKSLISIYEQSKPKAEEIIPEISRQSSISVSPNEEMFSQPLINEHYTKEQLEALGIKEAEEMEAEDLKVLVDSKEHARAIMLAQSQGQEVVNPLYDDIQGERHQSSEDILQKLSSERLSVDGATRSESTSSSLSNVDIPQEPKSLLAKLSGFLTEHKDSVTKIIGSIAPVAEAVLSKAVEVKGLATTCMEYNQAEGEQLKIEKMISRLSQKLTTAKDQEVIKATEEAIEHNKKLLEEEKQTAKEKYASIISQGIEIAKDPTVIATTGQAIKDNKELLVSVIDKKLDELRKDKEGVAAWLLNRINGEFCVKAIEHANNPASLAAIQKIIEKKKISGALYLAYKTNNLKIVIGAVVGYFKPKEKTRYVETTGSVNSPMSTPRGSVSSERRNSVIREQ